jgi:putative acetyltransferase
MNMLTIRPERPDQPDVVALLGALDAYLASLYPPEANHILGVPELLAPEVHFVVARRGGRAVGTGAARVRGGEAATAGRAYGEIKRMYVDPAERGQRVGEQVLGTLEQQLAAEGVALALLETGAEQAAAVRLYERCGYRPRAAFGGYPDNGLSVFYEKRL